MDWECPDCGAFGCFSLDCPTCQLRLVRWRAGDMLKSIKENKAKIIRFLATICCTVAFTIANWRFR